MIERAFERVPAERLYAAAGIQTMPINTVFQLLADEGSAALQAAQRIALVPDLLALWLCGELANERTNASTTGPVMTSANARIAIRMTIISVTRSCSGRSFQNGRPSGVS